MNKLLFKVSNRSVRGWGFTGVKLLKLTFVEFVRSGHSVFAVVSDGAKNYPMFLVDLEVLMTSGSAGTWHTNFEVCARGGAFGLREVEV